MVYSARRPGDETTIQTASPASFREAMRGVASGVAIITSGRSDEARGLTATAFCSLSAEPPAVLVCVNRESQCHGVILSTGSFCLNVLKADSEALAHRFAGRGGIKGSDRFLEGNWTTLRSGAPVLSDALAVFDCQLREAIISDTHSILIGDVTALMASGQSKALIYRSGWFGSI